MFWVNPVRCSGRINHFLRLSCFEVYFLFLLASLTDVVMFPVEWLHLRRRYCLRTCVEICRGRSGRGRRRRRWRGPLDQFIMRIFEHKVGIRSKWFQIWCFEAWFLIYVHKQNLLFFVPPPSQRLETLVWATLLSLRMKSSAESKEKLWTCSETRYEAKLWRPSWLWLISCRCTSIDYFWVSLKSLIS